jgi:hypothetical protein
MAHFVVRFIKEVVGDQGQPCEACQRTIDVDARAEQAQNLGVASGIEPYRPNAALPGPDRDSHAVVGRQRSRCGDARSSRRSASLRGRRLPTMFSSSHPRRPSSDDGADCLRDDQRCQTKEKDD